MAASYSLRVGARHARDREWYVGRMAASYSFFEIFLSIPSR